MQYIIRVGFVQNVDWMHEFKTQALTKGSAHRAMQLKNRTENQSDNEFTACAAVICAFKTSTTSAVTLLCVCVCAATVRYVPYTLYCRVITFGKLSCQLSLIEPQRRPYMMDCVHFFACGKYSAVNTSYVRDPSGHIVIYFIHFFFSLLRLPSLAMSKQHILHILLSLKCQMYERIYII